ncbi:DUF6118 family protein [Methylobacterium sp. AMS5]|uniref:DUF6118 family protein n=1 Tax=Methylobacterium sp. AMS5 TaxID=925818 RepID=UPI00336A9B77
MPSLDQRARTLQSRSVAPHAGTVQLDPKFAEADAADDDASAAFAALRATVEGLAADLGGEMGVIRRGVEAAFDRFERQGAVVDYGTDLARLTQGLATVGERLRAVEQSPLLRHSAEHYARVMESRAEGLVQMAVQGLERQTKNMERVRGQLAAHVEGVRERRRQNLWLGGVGGAAFLGGVLAVLFLPRVLPSSVEMSVAATVLNADRWRAGGTLMQAGSPVGWQGILDASRLVQVNREVLSGCREAAAKAGKEQRCTLIVSVPAQ